MTALFSLRSVMVDDDTVLHLHSPAVEEMPNA